MKRMWIICLYVYAIDGMELTINSPVYFSQRYTLPICNQKLVAYVMQLIANHKDLNQKHTYDAPPLLLVLKHARYYDMYDIVNTLIDHGANVNLAYDSNTVLIDALVYRAPLTILDVLIKRGAQVNQKAPCGLFPLQQACWYLRIPAIELLLTAGADVTHNGFEKIFGQKLDFKKREAILIGVAKVLMGYGASLSTSNIISEVSRHNLITLQSFIQEFTTIRNSLFNYIDIFDLNSLKGLLKKWGYIGWRDQSGLTMIEHALKVESKTSESIDKKNVLIGWLLTVQEHQIKNNNKNISLLYTTLNNNSYQVLEKLIQ